MVKKYKYFYADPFNRYNCYDYSLEYIECMKLCKPYFRAPYIGVFDVDNQEIALGDIIEIEAFRAVRYGTRTKRSINDKFYMARFEVIYDKGSYKIKKDNPYNNAILSLKGKEEDERAFNVWDDFNHLEDFKIIGNKIQNMDLLHV